MKLFNLVLYQSCNYKCKDCPMKEWLYKPDEICPNGFPRNGITNELLVSWLENYLDPEEWFILINGGEPSLYPELSELIAMLANHNYKGLIYTNGSKKIPGRITFKRIACWHEDKPVPRYYDFILILEEPDFDWEEKEKYCKDNNIPYAVFPYINFCSDKNHSSTYPSQPNKIFDKMTTMFSSGALTGCFCGGADLVAGPSLQKMSPPVIYDLHLNSGCQLCGNITAIEYFINNIPDLKEFTGLSEKPLNEFFIVLTAKGEYMDETGKILGKTGDNYSEINERYQNERRGKECVQ